MKQAIDQFANGDSEAKKFFANSFYVLTSLGLGNSDPLDKALGSAIAFGRKYQNGSVGLNIVKAAYEQPKLLESLQDNSDLNVEHRKGIILMAEKFPGKVELTGRLIGQIRSIQAKSLKDRTPNLLDETIARFERFVENCPNIQITPTLIDLYRKDSDAFLGRLEQFAKDFPDVQITMDHMSFFTDENAFEAMQEFVKSAEDEPDAEKLLKLMRFCIKNSRLSEKVWKFAKDFPEMQITPRMVELYSSDGDAFKKAHEFVKNCPAVKITPGLMELCKDAKTLERLKQFAKDFHEVRITSSLMELSKNEVKFAVARLFIKKFPNVNVLMTAELVDLSLDHKYKDAFAAVHQLAKVHHNVQMSAELVELYEKNPSAFENLQQFAKAHDDVKITPAVVTLFAREPGITEKIASIGTVDYAYESFAEQKGEETDVALNYENTSYRHETVRLAVGNLFAAGEVDDARIAGFLKHESALGSFIGDGHRKEMPAMVLPNDVRVVSNEDREKFYKEIGKLDGGNDNQFQIDYLKYLVGQFKKAYGSRARNAFYVYMQNFTGPGNSMVCIGTLANRCTIPDFTFTGVNLSVSQATRRLTMVMDENFNATYDVVYDMSLRKENAALVEEFKVRGEYPQWYDGNAVIVATARVHIPAAYNPDASDPYDQRGQKGKQETHTSVIASYPPKPAQSSGTEEPA
jgi:hypothetical protein